MLDMDCPRLPTQEGSGPLHVFKHEGVPAGSCHVQ